MPNCLVAVSMWLISAMRSKLIPLALMGVSLAWLMATPETTVSSYADREDEVEHPLAVVSGEMRRAGARSVGWREALQPLHRRRGKALQGADGRDRQTCRPLNG